MDSILKAGEVWDGGCRFDIRFKQKLAMSRGLKVGLSGPMALIHKDDRIFSPLKDYMHVSLPRGVAVGASSIRSCTGWWWIRTIRARGREKHPIGWLSAYALIDVVKQK